MTITSGPRARGERRWDARDSRNFFARFAVDPLQMFRVWPDYAIPADQRAAFERLRTVCVASRSLANKFGWKLGERITYRAFTATLPGQKSPELYEDHAIQNTRLWITRRVITRRTTNAQSWIRRRLIDAFASKNIQTKRADRRGDLDRPVLRFAGGERSFVVPGDARKGELPGGPG